MDRPPLAYDAKRKAPPPGACRDLTDAEAVNVEGSVPPEQTGDQRHTAGPEGRRGSGQRVRPASVVYEH